MKIIFILCRVWEFFQIVNYKVEGTGNCEGPRICCMGYMWNKEEAKCIRCDIGFIGALCDIPCPYPLYGQECQKKCECEEHLCNPSSGCVISKCQKGYHGKFCTERCEYPTFGSMCSNTCACDRGLCDFLSGCTNESMNTFQMHSFDVTFKLDNMNNQVILTTTAENTYTPNWSEQEPFSTEYIYILSTTIPLLFLGMIALAAFLGYKSATKKSPRAVKADAYYHEINESPLENAILDYNSVHIQATHENDFIKIDSRNKISTNHEQRKLHTPEVNAKQSEESEVYLMPNEGCSNANFRNINESEVYLTVISD